MAMSFAMVVAALVAAASAQLPDDQLILSQVIFNPGAHSAIEQLPSHKIAWKDGLGALSALGARDSTRLGSHLRARYMHDLGALLENSTWDQIAVETCSSQLSQQAGLAVGAGLAARAGEPWPRAWRPVHTTVAADTSKLDSTELCPGADAKADELVFASPWFSDSKNAAFLRLMTQRAGLGRLTTLRQLYTLWDAAQAMKEQGIAWPAWLEEGKLRTLKSLLDAGAVIAMSDEKVARLRGGPMLEDVLLRIAQHKRCLSPSSDETATCRSNALIYAFAADDWTLHAVKAALGVPVSQLPERASAIAIELWRTKNGQDRIKVLTTDGSSELREQAVRGCSSLECPLVTFEQHLRDKFVSDEWYAECGLDAGINPRFEPQSKFCDSESDHSSAERCLDWAKFKYCEKDHGVRFVYCRYTCLCDARFAAAFRR